LIYLLRNFRKISGCASILNTGELVVLALNKKLDIAVLKTATTIYKGGQTGTPQTTATAEATSDDDLIKERICPTAAKLNAAPAATQSR
jgi:hypothetical protein